MLGVNSMYKRFAALLLLPGGAVGAPAFAEDADFDVNVTVVVPASLTNTQGLDFGKIVPSGSRGIVTINARNGNRSGNANVTLIGTDFSRGLFDATGEPGMTVTVSGSARRIFLAGPGGARMRVNRFRISRNNARQRGLPRNYAIPASGSMTLGLGGRLRVGANQTPGLYTGTFDLTMEYQ